MTAVDALEVALIYLLGVGVVSEILDSDPRLTKEAKLIGVYLWPLALFAVLVCLPWLMRR